MTHIRIPGAGIFPIEGLVVEKPYQSSVCYTTMIINGKAYKYLAPNIAFDAYNSAIEQLQEKGYLR